MARTVPFFADYKTIGILGTTAEYFLWISVTTSVAGLTIEHKIVTDSTGNLQSFLTGMSGLLAVLYFLIDLLSNYLFQCAEIHRRNDLFDNGLNTVLANQNSQNYFTNDNLPPSVYKLGVNTFENSFFTQAIARKFLQSMIIKSAIVLIAILCVTIFGGNRLLLNVLQLTLPFTIIQQTARLLILKNRVEAIHENFKRIFQLNRGDKQDSLLIHNITSYEAALAWASIKLPDEIFSKMNRALSAQWNLIKQRLNI